jgi:acyl-CoA synthetase (AMP-forming)/AMP-acid ligase II
MTIGQRFTEVAKRYSGELAIIDGEHRLTYGRLAEEIDLAAKRMAEAFPIAPGDVIAASLRNGLEFVTSFFAVAQLGGTFLPVNPQWRSQELRDLTQRLNVRCTIPPSPESFRAARVSERSALPVAPRFEPAAYLTTSGSTGVPRIVPRTHRNLLAGAENVAQALNIGPGHRFLSVVPFHHSNGFHNCMIMPLMAGACVVTLQNFSPAACVDLIQREGANVLIGSPFIYSCLADRDFSSVPELCISAGARMPVGLAQRWRDRFGVRVRQLYGSTETSVISIDQGSEDHAANGAGAFVGSPIPGVEVKRFDATGELAVRSPAVMSGYFGEPELNATVFQDGFFLTGDLGFIDERGELCLTGRSRRVINLGGIKVDPVEVERVVEELPGVEACFVDAGAGGREGEIIRARIVLRSGVEITRAQVVEICRSRLAEYKLPRIIEFLDALPTSVSGKTIRDL